MPFISARNIDECHLNLEKEYRFISNEAHTQLTKQKCSPHRGDVLVAKSGKIGTATTNNHLTPFSVFESVAIVRFENEIDADYAAAFLNTHYAQTQINRMQKGAVQKHLHLEELREVKIPVVSISIQTALGNQIRKVERLRQLALCAKQHAFELLVEHLRFHELAASEKVPTWSDVGSMHARLDAEFYQPCYLGLDSYASGLPETVLRVDTLGELITGGAYGVLPPSEQYGKGDLPFLRAQDLGEFFVEFRDPVLVPQEYENKKAITSAGDLLLEVKGAIQGAAVCPKEAVGFLVNGSIYRAGIKDGIHPYYLTAILTTPFGRLQKQRAAANSIISYLSADFLEAILVPRIGDDLETEIGGLLERFCALSYEANELLSKTRMDIESLVDGVLDETMLLEQDADVVNWLASNELHEQKKVQHR